MRVAEHCSSCPGTKLTRTHPCVTCSRWLALAGGLDWVICRAPFQPQLFWDSVVNSPRGCSGPSLLDSALGSREEKNLWEKAQGSSKSECQMGFTSQVAPVLETTEKRQGSGVSEEEFQAALLKRQAEPGAITLLVTITSITHRLPGEEPWQSLFHLSFPLQLLDNAGNWQEKPQRGGSTEKHCTVCGDTH